MKPETQSHIDRAQENLQDASRILEISITKIAARCANFAAFHAAQALICEITGKTAKTHAGVGSEFSRLAR